MPVPVFRFAPSPNGRLHLGHAYSALLNEARAREHGGRFLVRIEDIDTTRCTHGLSVHALVDLRWLGLTWEEPVRYQSQHMPDYRAQQLRLLDLGVIYPCFCTRKERLERGMRSGIDPDGQPIYDKACAHLSRTEVEDRLATGEPAAYRLDMDHAIALCGKKLTVDPRPWGDVVLVRRDIGTSYHVAVVTDDALQGVTHVVRGADLEASTSIHLLLQQLLELPSPFYEHHRLLKDDAGQKLSKSLASRSLNDLRADGVIPDQIRAALGFA